MKDRNILAGDDWRTPPEFYKKLNNKFNFDFDPCPWRHDLTLWDGLKDGWGSVNFINPPYSLKLKTAFVQKAYRTSSVAKNVLLLPVSTSTKLFHLYLIDAKITFVKGRLRFIGVNAKGQRVNFDQLQETTKETILFEGKEIPKFINNSGMFDSMVIEL